MDHVARGRHSGSELYSFPSSVCHLHVSRISGVQCLCETSLWTDLYSVLFVFYYVFRFFTLPGWKSPLLPAHVCSLLEVGRCAGVKVVKAKWLRFVCCKNLVGLKSVSSRWTSFAVAALLSPIQSVVSCAILACLLACFLTDTLTTLWCCWECFTTSCVRKQVGF